MAFYNRFESLCDEKGISPAQVRADLGISQSTMASWKSRDLTPKASTLQKLADYFGVSVACLLGVEKGRVKMPTLDVGNTYFDGAVKVIKSDVEANRTCIVFEVDDDKMSASELLSFLDIMETISNRSGVSIEGLALLAEAASKALKRSPASLQFPENAPKSVETALEGKDTTPDETPTETPQNPPEDET